MDTNFIALINAKIAELKAKKQSLEAQIADIAIQLERHETTVSVLREVTGVNIDGPSASPTAANLPLGRALTKRDQILTGTLDLLKGGPMATDDILDELGKRGVVVSGNDRKTQLRNISSYLSKAKNDIGIEPTRYGWALKEHKALSDATDVHASQSRE